MLLLLAGCSMFKNIKLFKAGEMANESFYETVDFEQRKGFIIIKARVNGEEREFILDSGAPNLISKSLAEQLGLTTASEGRAVDSKGQIGVLEIVTIDTITIGSLSFANTAAMVFELDSITDMHCMGVDGLIGANLMRHAIWEINFEDKKIILTDDLSRLKNDNNSIAVDFTTDVQGTPYFHAQLGENKLKNIMFDLGSAGSISVPYKTFNKIIETEKATVLRGYGARSYGIFGHCFDTSYSALTRQLQFGQMNMDSIVISSDKNSKAHPILGTNILRDYNFILNWQEKQILFKVKNKNTRDKRSFGFGFGLQGNKLFVMYVFEDSPAGNAGIIAGSQILEIYGQNVEQLTVDGYCSLTAEKYKEETLYLSIKEGDSVRELVLDKEYLFR